MKSERSVVDATVPADARHTPLISIQPPVSLIPFANVDDAVVETTLRRFV